MKLSSALSRQPDSFPPSYGRVVNTGEATGQLEECLSELAMHLEKQGQAMQRISSALVYPSFLIASSVAMVVLLLYVVFPMILKVTADAGVNPPALTRWLIYVARPRMLLGAAFTIGLSLWAGRKIIFHPVLGPRARLALELTPVGRFWVNLNLLRSLRQFSLMQASGVDLLKSLSFAGDVGAGSALVRHAFDDVVKRVRMGDTLADALRRHSIMSKTLVSMVAIAEETGTTHQMVTNYCDLLEENLNNRIDSLTLIVEPVLLGTLGFVVGLILVAAFLPIYGLINL